MAIAIGIIFLSPILLLLLPSFIANSIHPTPGYWHVFVPKESYLMYGIAFLMLFIAPLTIFIFDVKRITITVGILFLCFSGFFFFFASFHYISIGSDSIKYREGFFEVEYEYCWEEISRVKYNEVPMSEGFSEYNIYFMSGNMINLPENGKIKEFRRAITNTLQEKNIIIE